jgi:histidyl-tRNA synthetase
MPLPALSSSCALSSAASIIVARRCLAPRFPWGVHSGRAASSSSSPSSFAAARGTRDYAGAEAREREAVEAAFARAARRRGYGRVETPLFENVGVFARTLGDASDVVMKEMYTVAAPRERGTAAGDSPAPLSSSASLLPSKDALALRPEGTAGVMRALVSGALASASAAAADAASPSPPSSSPSSSPLPPLPTPSNPFRIYYSGPMFRHERPQKGRYRQFTQLGLELAGAGSWQADVEVMDVADRFLRDVLPVAGRGAAGGGAKAAAAAAAEGQQQPRLTLLVNTLGDDIRPYSEALAAYFSLHKASLSADSRARLERGSPLRILDSKSKGDGEVIAGAPKLAAFMPEAALARFDGVLGGLKALGIPHRVEPRLVRGLDYYSHTVFEFVVENEAEREGEGGGGGGDGGKPTSSSSSSPPQPSSGPGQLGTVLAGGRYDRLAQMLGARERIPCVGESLGEREGEYNGRGSGGGGGGGGGCRLSATPKSLAFQSCQQISLTFPPSASLSLSRRRLGRRPGAALHPRRPQGPL